MGRIRDSLAPDGVHLTATGTKRIYNSILDAVSRIERQKQAGNGASKAGSRNGFYWRGFISPVGSAARGEGGGGGGPCRSGDLQGRERRYGNHPFLTILNTFSRHTKDQRQFPVLCSKTYIFSVWILINM